MIAMASRKAQLLPVHVVAAQANRSVGPTVDDGIFVLRGLRPRARPVGFPLAPEHRST